MVRFFPIALVIDRWTMLSKVFRGVNINDRTIYFFIEIVHFIGALKVDGFQRSHIDYCHEKSDTEGVAMRGENGGLSIFFSVEHGGP